jgi:hypothetical protein
VQFVGAERAHQGIEVAGYWWPEHAASWTAPADLERFLAAGPPPVFVGFGSRNPADAGRSATPSAATPTAPGHRRLSKQLASEDGTLPVNRALDRLTISRA